MTEIRQISNPYIISHVLRSSYHPTFYISKYLHRTLNCFGDIGVKFQKKEIPIQCTILKLNKRKEGCSDGK